MVTIFGLTWHLYGLILGLATWLGYELTVRQARRQKIAINFLQQMTPWVIVGGVFGARLYHVLTDWPLYISKPWEAFYLWNGGLSVIGAVAGGGVVLVYVLRRQRQLAHVGKYLDLAVFGLPFAQALGRLGNYFNHELYGRPTTLPWAIEIPAVYRLPGYETVSQYHPLFAYEALALLIFGIAVWWWAAQRKIQIGSGMIFASYVAYYAIVRFCLDFLRLQTSYLGKTGLTVNQAVMMLLLVAAVGWGYRNYGLRQKT